MSEKPPVRVERDGPLATLVIDRPPLNLFGEPLVTALVATIDEIERSDARALMLRAEGKVFTGGVDVHAFDGLGPDRGGDLMGGIELIRRIEELPIPTISAVHALCLTAGFELSLACDMIWAAESAQFGLVEIVVGLTPLMGGTQRVAERAGPARARELVMSGGLYPAETLERWNVVNRVLPDADLAEKAMRFGHRLAAGPTIANAATKRIVRAQTDEGTRGADARTADIGAPLFATEDLQEAVEKFLSEGPGKASFRGR
jgi:enoyl-CoA hydratase